jgi:hypothetical protein
VLEQGNLEVAAHVADWLEQAGQERARAAP